VIDYGDDDDNDETDEKSDSDSYETEEESSENVATTCENNGSTTTTSSGKSSLEMVQSVLGKVGRLLYRVAHAAFETSDSDQNDDDEQEAPSTTILTRVCNTLNRMFQAAFSPSSSSSSSEANTRTDDHDDDDEDDDDDNGRPKHNQEEEDFGRILAQAYRIEAGRYSRNDENEDAKAATTNMMYSPILTGSFMDALKKTRSQARLLVVLIPAENPSRRSAADMSALQSFLSRDVAVVAESKARKTKKQQQGETDKFLSFFLWSANAGSSEAALTVKRLKAQTSSKKVPMLLVAYLKPGVDKRTGAVQLVPCLLAQHHCSPPPPPKTMAAWLNALRKRHARQYVEMQTQLQELEHFRQRQEGYHSSVTSDTAQRAKEHREAAERQAEQAAAKLHKESILARRQELRKALPLEPDADMPNVKTIALRLPNGQSAQRRFAPETKLETLFNWVDVDFEMERETVVLTTLNGQQSFSWHDSVIAADVDGNNEKTLADAGLSKMTGLRVTKHKKKEPAEQSKKETTIKASSF
jgi:UBX domain